MITIESIKGAEKLAHEAFDAANSISPIEDDERLRILQKSVKDLANAVITLAGEALQVGRGVSAKRITVVGDV